jgi:hypothetical protein
MMGMWIGSGGVLLSWLLRGEVLYKGYKEGSLLIVDDGGLVLTLSIHIVGHRDTSRYRNHI